MESIKDDVANAATNGVYRVPGLTTRVASTVLE